MEHIQLTGTHYEAGFQWGSLLFRRQIILTDHIPFPITRERIDFARACLPVYAAHFPQILEELRGLADGQRCDAEILQAVLFSMYAIPPACGCSCFAAATDKGVLLGRNSDFLTALEGNNCNVIYRLSGGGHAFTGNTTSFLQMEDGVNDCGLAAGLTSVGPTGRKPGFNAGLLLRYLLEHCESVAQAVAQVGRLPLASAMTLTLADPSGAIAVVECDHQKLETAPPPGQSAHFVCATNSFHLPGMAGRRWEREDDWSADERYETMTSALGRHAPDLAFARALLSGEHGFLCQYDRSTGRDTVWSVIYDLTGRRIFRSEGNPRRCPYVQDLRFSF